MKIIAYYLPQFHEVDENNEWWGKGFTEWTNVRKANSLFPGHYQPRVPLNDNYYDLSELTTLQWQIDLAKEYGIYGFCMYHYWFNGKLLLEKPVELFLANEQLKMPFCFSWANEDWTNGWVSDKNKVLISHDNTKKNDWINHFNYLLKFFADERYIKIDGMPLVILYMPSILSKNHEMIECWRELAIKNGLPGLHVLYQNAIAHFDNTLDKAMFDGGIEFQPQYSLLMRKTKLRRTIDKHVYDTISFFKKKMKINFLRRIQKDVVRYNYDEIWKVILSLKPNNSNIYPGAFVDWDNTPRKGRRGSMYEGATPIKFEHYLSIQIERAKKVYKKDYLFLFAWNEWGESGYLEPDNKNQYSYLKAVKHALIMNDEFPDY